MKKLFKYSWLLVLPMVAAAIVVWKASADPVVGCPELDPLDGHVLLPNPKNCSSYFSCVNGLAILMFCPDGLIFNAVLDVCDWPSEGDCKGSTNGEEGAAKYNICYYESVVVKGRTYYDCGDCCDKVYDEKGKGHASKCFYKEGDCE